MKEHIQSELLELQEIRNQLSTELQELEVFVKDKREKLSASLERVDLKIKKWREALNVSAKRSTKRVAHSK